MWSQMGKLTSRVSRMPEERPPIEELQRVHVIDDFGESYVELSLNIHRNGDAAEPLTIEYHPYEDGMTRILQLGRLDEEEQRKYRIFGAMVGRLAYHEP